MAATLCLDELESLPPAMYSYAWNHDPTYCDKLRSLKRRLTELQLHHLHDLSARWIRAFAVSITDSTIIKRFLPWDPRGFVRVPSEYGGPPASIEADALWREFTSGLTAISDKFEQEIDPREQLSPKQTEAFVEAAMIFVEPYFAEQEAWEDAHMMKLLPKVLARHFWTGKVGEAPGGSEKKAASGTPAPAPAAPGPWWGAFRYTIDASGMRADVHIHNHLAPESPFSDTARYERSTPLEKSGFMWQQTDVLSTPFICLAHGGLTLLCKWIWLACVQAVSLVCGNVRAHSKV